MAENLNEMKQGLVRLDAISFGAYWMPFHLELTWASLFSAKQVLGPIHSETKPVEGTPSLVVLPILRE